MSPSPLAAESDHTQVVGVRWEMFDQWFRDTWEPGQHVALIGPTGEGKSNFAVQILKQRKYVLALDPKGEDETLAKSGFARVTSWPLDSKIRDRIAEGGDARLIVGGSVRTAADKQALVSLMHQVVEGVRGEGRWTVYADEFQLLSDRRMYGLDKPIEELLIAARSRGTSVVTSFQAPAWVPKAATRQATFCVMFPNHAQDMVKVVAESMGRTWQEIVAAAKALPSYHVLVIPKRARAPMVITKAPKL